MTVTPLLAPEITVIETVTRHPHHLVLCMGQTRNRAANYYSSQIRNYWVLQKSRTGYFTRTGY